MHHICSTVSTTLEEIVIGIAEAASHRGIGLRIVNKEGQVTKRELVMGHTKLAYCGNEKPCTTDARKRSVRARKRNLPGCLPISVRPQSRRKGAASKIRRSKDRFESLQCFIPVGARGNPKN